MPSRPRSPAPLGALQPPKPVRHAAVSAQNHRRRAARPPGEARQVSCNHKRQPTTSKIADTRQRGGDTLCPGGRGGYSHRLTEYLWRTAGAPGSKSVPSHAVTVPMSLNPSPGHTKRQITMIAGASTGEWLRGPMHFGFGVLLRTHKTSAGRLSPDEVAPSSRNVDPHIFARDRTPRTAGGLTPP